MIIGGFTQINPTDNLSFDITTPLGLKAGCWVVGVSGIGSSILKELNAEPEAVADHNDTGLKWVFEAIAARGPAGAKEVGKVIDGINRLIAARDFGTLDRILSYLPAKSASEYVLVAFVRSSFPVRAKLPNWSKALSGVRNAFKRRGLDYTRLLKGLN